MKKWRRRRYFINRSVQSRHMGMTALIVFIIALITGWFVYSSIWYAITERVQNEPQLHQILAEINEILLMRSILVILAGISCAVILTLFISHRIAGPIFRIRRTLEELGEGNVPRKITLRQRDEFKELSEAVNSVIDKTEEISRVNREAVENIKNMPDKAPWLEKELEKFMFFEKK